ncbi:hypothetical protein AMECASPLE_001631 [Ameca splendens]|uniref:Uncharacterized protein n=1 Tax=Ameca splendens TaxID=208324 RepID=A0ABV0Z6X4_9TELE
MVQSIQVSAPLNVPKNTKRRVWSGLIKVRASIQLRCCDLKLAVNAPNVSNGAELKKKNGPNVLHSDVKLPKSIAWMLLVSCTRMLQENLASTGPVWKKPTQA